MNLSIKSTLSSLVGNMLEWYEYTLYAYFATVISHLFFPTDNHYVGMMLTFATFAVGLAARPIGGIIFGHIGDKYSRRKMLAVTMLLMSIPTFCIGMLPTYASIGIFAPIILICLRIIQGIALGGEFGASCVYLYESAPPHKRGFFGTLALTGVGMGLVLSACTIFVIESIFTIQEVYAYAWRIPFFISVAGAMIALYMRRTLLETNDFTQAKLSNLLIENPFKEMLKNHKTTLVKLFAVFLTTQISFFVVFIFGKSMMIEFLNFKPEVAGKYNLFTVLSYTLSTVFFGYLSDKFDKRYIILFGVIGIAAAAYPFISSLMAGHSQGILGMSLLMGMLIGMTEGTLNPLVAESFPTQIRATSVAFCWNFTSVAFGAASPMVAMFLIKNAGGVETIAYYLMGVCMVSVMGMGYIFLSARRAQFAHAYMARDTKSL